MPTDDELYGQYLAGGLAAYDELMLRYGDSLTLYLCAVLHDLHDAEDMMIEAFARIMVKHPAIRAGGFKAYLFKTGRNLASRFASKRGRAQTFALEAFEEDLAAPERPEAHYLNEERKQALHRCLNRIDPAYREALWLVYMEDMSYRQASDVLNVSEKKLDHLLQRGKQILRQELEKEGVTDAHE